MIEEGALSSFSQALGYVERRLMEDDNRPKYGPLKWTKAVKLEKD